MRRALLLSVAAFVVAGCAAEQATRQAAVDASGVGRLAARAQTPAPFQDTGIVQSRPDQIYIGANVRQSSSDRTLPQEWRGRNVTFVNAKPQGFREVLALVQNTTKLPVSYSAAVSRQVQAVAGTATADSTMVRTGATLPPPTMAAGPVPAGFNVSAAQALVAGNSASSAAPSTEGALPTGRMNINFTGTLSQFLDQVASNFGVSWSMDGDRIVFSSVTTEVFDIPALPVVLKLATQFSSQGPSIRGGGGGGLSTGGSGGGGGSGDSSDSVQSSTAVDLWKEINAALKSIVSQANGGLDVSGSTGTVTVTGSRDLVQNVRRYVSEINSRLSKQVVLSMAVYAVTLTRTDTASSNVAPLLQAGGLQIFGASGAAPFPSGPVMSGRAGPAIGLIVDPARNPSNSLAGSQAVVEALSRAGEVSVVNSQSVTTMNNIPVPFRDVNTRGYAAQVSTTVVGGAASASPQTSIIPGSVQTGYSMRLTPRINNDGTVLIEYALDLSELNGPQEGFRTFSTGSQTIQLPDVNSRNGVGQARIPAGATLVLTGLERTRVDSARTGPVTPGLWMMGGARSGGVRRELVVITITPEIVDLGMPRASR